jgi:hypothetical protein
VCVPEFLVVSPRPDDRKWAAVGLDQESPLHPVLARVGGVSAYGVPLKRVLPIALSAACHSQSTPPNSSHSSTMAAQTRSKTPRPAQCWKVRCTELSSGNSLGRRFHWQPLLSLKMIASKVRWSMRERPVYFGGSCSLSISSIFSHSSSGTRQIAGSRFSSGSGCSAICALPLRGILPTIPEGESFEIVSNS